jgi:hypothetical protein
MTIDIEAEITKLQIGPTDFVVIAAPAMLRRDQIKELVEQIERWAAQSGVPSSRVLLAQAGLTVRVVDADEAHSMLAARA